MKLTKKTNEKKPITCRPSIQGAEWLERNFDSRCDGAGFCIDTLRSLYQQGIASLNGRFTAGELSIFLDVMNGTAMTAGLSGHVSANVSDCGPDGTPEKWGVNLQEMCEKFKTLSKIESLALDIWADGFWKSGFYEQENSIQKWTEALLLK